MNNRYFLTVVLLITTLLIGQLMAQTEVDERAMVNLSKGIGFHNPDGSFGLNIRTRMQSRAAFNFDEQLNLEDIEARVSRLRLRFDGYIKSKKLTYYIQLSFSRGDQDWDNTHVPNVVRDAMVYYHFNEHFYLGFGQGKLPGNRQRIVSSGQQQFHDRSNVNSNFTLDRDFGLFGYYTQDIGSAAFNVKGAISTGEGRNQLKTDNGLMYTARLELLPLGRFTRDGDFSEGDLEFEQKPKLSLGAGYSINNKATRSRGTTGSTIFEARDLHSFFADFILKYRGWALSSEYIERSTSQGAFTFNDDNSQSINVVVGNGINTQLSYCFPSFWEIAARYSVVNPDKEINTVMPKDEYLLLGVNKYINKHLTKVQMFTGYRTQTYTANANDLKHNFLLVLQVELGI